MMRGTVSLILISLVALQPVSVWAQEPGPDPELQRLLHDFPSEVARFAELHPSPIHLSGGQQTAAQEADTADRIRAKAQAIPVGSEVTFTLRTGEELEGQLVEVSDAEFTVRVATSEETRRVYGDETTTTKNYRFADVRTLFAGGGPQEIPRGKTVEVRLVGGEKFKGELTAVTDDGLTINDRQFALDEVLSVKTAMRTRTKTLMIVGIVAGLVFWFGVAAFAGAWE